MSDAAQRNDGADPSEGAALPTITVSGAKFSADFATIFGLFIAVGLVIAAIAMEQNDASFFNVRALMIVLFGTMAATAISYTVPELARFGNVVTKAMTRNTYNPSKVAKTLIDLSVVARKNGVLALSRYDTELGKHPYMRYVIQMVIDGYPPEDIERLVTQEIETLIERHKRSASIAHRASEVAPAMGLIGTLVGLVQMLAELENPETIGPAMAVALLTTFYGAMLGTVVMAPLAIKLEKNSTDEAVIRTLIMIAAVSMARQENPRRLEMLLNSELAPSERIVYFN